MSKYDDLLNLAQAYLLLAHLGCQEILNPCHDSIEESPNWKISYTVQLALPIIYNTKHGIECFLKVLQQIGEKQYGTNHDLDTLFQDALIILQSQKWIPVEDKWNEEEKGHEIDQQEIDNLPKVLEEIKDIVDYFYNNEILNEKLGTGKIPDPKNEVFRYSVMKKGRVINYNNFLIKLSNDDIKELQKKIWILYERFNDVGYFLAVSLRN